MRRHIRISWAAYREATGSMGGPDEWRNVIGNVLPLIYYGIHEKAPAAIQIPKLQDSDIIFLATYIVTVDRRRYIPRLIFQALSILALPVGVAIVVDSPNRRRTTLSLVIDSSFPEYTPHPCYAQRAVLFRGGCEVTLRQTAYPRGNDDEANLLSYRNQSNAIMFQKPACNLSVIPSMTMLFRTE